MLLLASVLAIGAGSIAGCNDMTDCPAALAPGTTCTTGGLSCFMGASLCTCTGGTWDCEHADMKIPDLAPRDMPAPNDLPKPID